MFEWKIKPTIRKVTSLPEECWTYGIPQFMMDLNSVRLAGIKMSCTLTELGNLLVSFKILLL